MTTQADARGALRKAAAIIQVSSNASNRTSSLAPSRLQSSEQGVVYPEASTISSHSGAYWRMEEMPLAQLHAPGSTSSPSTTPIRAQREPRTFGMGRFSTMWTDSTRTSSGVSPREAAWIDPQHRLLVECAWEALEDSGIPIEQLRGSRSGVYVGLGISDYAQKLGLGDPRAMEGYFATGTGASFSAGRISFPAGVAGAVHHGRHGMLLLFDGAAPRLQCAANGRMRVGSGGRCAAHAVAAAVRAAVQAAGAGARWPLQDVQPGPTVMVAVRAAV